MAELDIEELIAQLSLEEKIALLSGKDFWHTRDVPRLNIPSLRFTDGPNGARGTKFFNGVRAACLPCGTSLAATWDETLLRTAGALMGRETIAKGAHVILGPTVNIQRSPLGGRGFESFSEDPYLSGRSAAAMIQGIQKTGVSACLKHFVCNDLEHERQAVNCVVSERALREIYLAPFAIAIREANPWALMTAYNKVNGTHVSEHGRLLTKVLRKEWGYGGFIMSDWFGTYSAAESVHAGLDLEMPGPPRVRGPNVNVSLGSRKISEHAVDDRIRHLLELINRTRHLNIPENAPEGELDTPETAKLLREIAASGLVLLKNERGLLPIDGSRTVGVIGPNASFAAYSGGGSASLRPYYARTPLEGMSNFVKDVQFSQGACAYKYLPFLSNLTNTPDGRCGLIAKFYNDPPDTIARICHDEIYIDQSDIFLADYQHPNINPELFYIDLEGTLTPDVAGEYLFGCSVRGTAKLLIDGQLVVDNATTQELGGTFMGAGTREERSSKHLEKGRTYSILVQFGSSITQKVKKKGATAMRGGGIRLGVALRTDAEVEIERAVELAKKVDQVLICAGLNGEWESEGFDRQTMDLPGHTNALISAVAQANSNTVVVMQCGTPVSMPWIDEVPAVLQAWYGGNETGNAIADVLSGKVNPSGKLPLSFPKRNEDNPAFLNSRSERGRMLYGEDIYVGYRFYEKTKKEVLFPFGHGLSYTTFSLETLRISSLEEMIEIKVDVRNVGNRSGAEVVQVYVSQEDASVMRPDKELKGFKKVLLEPGENAQVVVEMNTKLTTSYWDEERDMWASEKGLYNVWVGNSSQETTLRGSFQIAKTTWWDGLY